MIRNELELRATVDALTGCLNRTATLELLEMLVHDRIRVAPPHGRITSERT